MHYSVNNLFLKYIKIPMLFGVIQNVLLQQFQLMISSLGSNQE